MTDSAQSTADWRKEAESNAHEARRLERAWRIEADRRTRAEERVVLLEGALERAREQLGKYDIKGPKQIGRALMTMEAALDQKQAESEDR